MTFIFDDPPDIPSTHGDIGRVLRWQYTYQKNLTWQPKIFLSLFRKLSTIHELSFKTYTGLISSCYGFETN